MLQPEPGSKPEQKLEPPSEAPKSVPKPAAGGEADALWKQVLARVQKVNALVHKSAAYGRAAELTEEQLTVSFPAEYAGKLRMINARGVAMIQGELDALRPGVKLLLRESEGDSDVAELMGIFKDKLTIS